MEWGIICSLQLFCLTLSGCTSSSGRKNIFLFIKRHYLLKWDNNGNSSSKYCSNGSYVQTHSNQNKDNSDNSDKCYFNLQKRKSWKMIDWKKLNYASKYLFYNFSNKLIANLSGLEALNTWSSYWLL